MTGFILILFSQVFGDTLRWCDPDDAGWNAVGVSGSGIMNWAVIFVMDSSLDGRTAHSGRVHIWEDMDGRSGTMRLCTGTMDSPVVVLDSGFFYATEQAFYEVFFGDTLVLNQGDTIWLWCTQVFNAGTYPASIDSGPAILGYGDLIKVDASPWRDLADLGLDYNWIMELILTPVDVKEGPVKPEEKLALLPALGGFWITGYKGEAWIYDPAGRLVLSKEIEGKTLIGPLRPGVYFVVAGRQRARVAVR
jgi:hypothetical protein